MPGLVPRSEFALDPTVSYWNHGGFGAVPRAVLAAQDRLRARVEANPTREFGPRWAATVAPSRSRAAELLGAEPGDLLPMANATTGTQTVLASRHWEPGDRVVITDESYLGVLAQVGRLARRYGVEVVSVAARPAAGLAARVEDALDARTRLVILDHVTSPTAMVLPVSDVAAVAHARGVAVLVDGAHAPGQLDSDVPGLGVDYWVGNLHKWAAVPRACGVLWAAAQARRTLEPLVASSAHDQPFDDAEYLWPGTHDPTPWLAVPAALDWLAAVGVDRLREHASRLLGQAAAELAQLLDGAEWVTPHPPCMRALALPHRLAPAQARALMDAVYEDSRVEVLVSESAGGSYLRLCAYAYTSEDDVTRLTAAVRRHARTLLGR